MKVINKWYFRWNQYLFYDLHDRCLFEGPETIKLDSCGKSAIKADQILWLRIRLKTLRDRYSQWEINILRQGKTRFDQTC